MHEFGDTIFLQCNSRPIVLAVVNRQLFSRNPLQIPTGDPLPRVSAWIVDRDFVLHCVGVGSRESLDEMELLGVRKAAIRKPKPLVEAFGVDNKGTLFPFPNCTAVVE